MSSGGLNAVEGDNDLQVEYVGQARCAQMGARVGWTGNEAMMIDVGGWRP
ncbi:unnamed protein product [marine sediment metagenome]|uniref:Uncharacterized protein n=1 Tax=marine sediment metagenome TaxID=412755 RepID=X1B202_9ZZZZ